MKLAMSIVAGAMALAAMATSIVVVASPETGITRGESLIMGALALILAFQSGLLWRKP